MKISYLNTDILSQTAITALKDAYEECSDTAAKKAIIAAFKAVIQLHHDLGKNSNHDMTSENADDFDPCEYCAAI